MSYDVIRHTLSASVANAGAFTVAYPDNKNSGSYELGVDHSVISNKYGNFYDGAKVSFAFGATNVTITNNSGVTLEAGTEILVQMDQPGEGDAQGAGLAAPEFMSHAYTVWLNLGAPDAIVTNGIAAAQSNTGAHALILNGALVVDGVAILDVPRNVIIDSGGDDTAVLTITGTDLFGAVMRESLTLTNATAVAGKKAFKTVTSITSSATITNGAFVGTGDVLGLPGFVSDTGRVLKELQDGAPATAGTVVAGVRAKATATTGDVRGTYDPNAACDGAKAFNLLVALDNPGDRGVAQFAG